MKSQESAISCLTLVNLGFALLGVLQALVIGRIFGVSPAIEVYFASVVIYQSVVKLTQTGQILEMFTPLYHEIKAGAGAEPANSMMAVFTNWLIILFLPISILAWWLAPTLIPFTVPGFDEDRTQEAVSMFRWLIPLLVIKIVERIFASYLNAEKRFIFPELVKLLFTAGGLALIAVFSHQIGTWVMIAALWFSVGGALVANISLAMWKGYRHSFRLKNRNFQIGAVLSKIPSLFAYVTCTQIFTLTLTAALTLLPGSALALYTYATKLFSVGSRLAQKPLSVVFFNHFSNAAASNSPAAQNLVKDAFRIALVINTLISTLFLSSGYLLIKMILEGPEFPTSDLYTTYKISGFLFLSLFLSTPALIYRKINISHQRIKAQYTVASLIQLTNAILAYILIPLFGVSGIIIVLMINSLLIALANGVLVKVLTPSPLCFYKLKDLAGCLLGMLVSLIPALVLHNRQFEIECFIGEFVGTKIALPLMTMILVLMTLCLMWIFSIAFKVNILNYIFKSGFEKCSGLWDKTKTI